MPALRRMIDMSPGAAFHADTVTMRGRAGSLRRSDYFEILAVERGRGWHVLSTAAHRGTREELLPGQLFLLRPFDVHEFGSDDAGGVSLAYVDFSVGTWRELMAVSDLDEAWFSSPDVPRAEFDPGAIDAGRPFHAAIDAVRRGPTAFDMMRFWIDVMPVFVAADRDRHRLVLPPWLSRSLDAMREESNLRGGVARLLALSHVSPAHLSRTVRQQFGVTPTAIVTEFRLRHAAMLLTTTRESIGIIAARCGFANANYFSTCFRALYAGSPREYRRRAVT